MPLSDKTKTIVKATVPILEGGGEMLTKHFYGIMLNEFPEVAPYFNKTHQASGAQPRALAKAVLMYAKNIDHLENLGGLVTQIVQKHVALAVKADHYPIIGTCLLRAMSEVLGPETATKEVIDAWAEAYFNLADILIAAEEKCYATTEAKTGGWRETRPFKLLKKEKESSEVTSFYFTPADGKPVVDFLPGQYIGMQAFIWGTEYRRNYTLSALPNGSSYRISVKHEPRGAVSHFLHEIMRPDATINLLPPAGYMTLTDSNKPLILLAGGIGITPMLPMMEHALQNSSRQITFVHCCKNKNVQAFAGHIEDLSKAHPDRLKIHNWYTDESHKRIGLDKMQEWGVGSETDVDAYFCGPTSFMRDMKKHLLAVNIPASQLHYEFFGPAGNIDK